MDLFANPINGNNKYVRPIQTREQHVVIPELEAELHSFLQEAGGSGDVDLSILSSDVIEVSAILFLDLFRDVPFDLNFTIFSIIIAESECGDRKSTSQRRGDPLQTVWWMGV